MVTFFLQNEEIFMGFSYQPKFSGTEVSSGTGVSEGTGEGVGMAVELWNVMMTVPSREAASSE